MAQPDNVSRFFYYLSILRSGGTLSHALVAEGVRLPDRFVPPVKLRQYLDDMAYLKSLIPLVEPDSILESQQGRHSLVRVTAGKRLSESEFLPFLGALSRTTNLFPYSVDGWLASLSRNYGNPALEVLDGRILYTSTPHPDRLKSDHFHTLVESLVHQTRVDLTYRNREGVERKVDFEALCLLNHNGVWYLVGDGLWSHRAEESSQPTQLKLSRIRLCRPSSRPFRHRFDVVQTTQRLRQTYGSHLILQEGSEPLVVTLRFFGDAVGFVKESYFHQGQVLNVQDDFCDLTLRVNDLFDALQLAGQWGSLVRPLSPPELVRRWREHCEGVAQWARSVPGSSTDS